MGWRLTFVVALARASLLQVAHSLWDEHHTTGVLCLRSMARRNTKSRIVMRMQPHFYSRKVPKFYRGVQLLSLLALTAITTTAAPAEVTVFTGGDPGEGLDMQGNFTYAVNVGPSGAAGKVGDANFTA